MFKRLKNFWKLYNSTKDNRVNHIFTDEETKESFAVKGLKKQIRVMADVSEKQEEMIKTLIKSQNLTKGNITDNLIEMVAPILIQKIAGQKPVNNGFQTDNSFPAANSFDFSENTHSQTKLSQQEINYSDEQIENLMKLNPKLVEAGKKLDDDSIKRYLMEQEPGITQQSLKKIICKIRE